MPFRQFACSVLVSFVLLAALGSAVAAEKEETDQVTMSLIGEQSRSLLKEARSFRYLNLPSMAIEKYKELLFMYPENPFVIKELGDANAENKNFEHAKEYYDRAIFLRPYDAGLRLAYVRGLYDNGQKQEAIQEARKVVENDPSFLEGAKELARLLNWENKPSESLQVYDQLLAKRPGDVELLLEKARALNDAGKYKDAIPVYEDVVAKQPDNTAALKELALLYSWTEQWKKSERAFEKLLKSAPTDPQVLEELGNAYYFDQKYESARRLYGQAAESNPDATRRLSARMSDMSFAMAPTLTYSFLYYRERSRRDIPDNQDYDGDTHSISESYYHTMEYIHPITHAIKMIANITSRYDTTIHRTSWIYGMGAQIQIAKFWWHQIGLSWEPKCWKINPRWSLNNVSTIKPAERWEVELFHRFTTYWDGNKSNSAGFGINRAFLEKRNLVLGYRFTVDEIDDPSSYFVTIKVPDNDKGAPLSLITNTLYVEKYWQLTPALMATTGTSYDVTTQGRSTVTIYGNMSYRVGRHLSIVGGSSGSWDNKDVQTVSGSGYLNCTF